MKGVIVSMPGTGRTCIKTKDMLYFFKRYGFVCFLGLALVLGLFFGALSAADADEQMLNSLDFLFITNFKARISQSLFLTFAASLTSYFIFYIGQFLLGMCAWGTAVLPATTFLKGFGIGLCAGYLYGTYQLQGVGFYLLVMLPGAFFSSIAMLLQGKEAFSFSKSIFTALLPKRLKGKQSPPPNFTKYLVASSYILILAALAAALDVLTSLCFSGVFSFS